jgi:uncharacterized membrane protein YraQ (UPF0718 family)
MVILLSFTIISIIISFLFDDKKTLTGIKKGLFMLLKILPPLTTVIIIVSILLFVTPRGLILKYLGNDSGLTGYVLAALIGAITLMPGFIAYPLCGFLIKNGVSYPIIAVFVTTLMMVGVVTIPIEKKYFGLKVTLLRNGLSFIGALVIGMLIGLLW